LEANQKTGTIFICLLVVIAFLDEVLTFKAGEVFITPLKVFSVYAFILYLSKIQEIRRTKKPVLFISFRFLYSYVIISLIISGFYNGISLSMFERAFHFFSSLIIINLIYDFLLKKQINFRIMVDILIWIFYVELAVSMLEVIYQRPLINVGIVELSKLRIRGFHADRVFLAEYLFVGLMLLYIKKANIFWFLGIAFLCVVVTASSGSNTALVLIAIGGLYVLYNIKKMWLRVILMGLCVVGVVSISLIRQATLSESDLIEIQKRQEMYYSDVDGTSNWRLFATTELINDFISNPTLFGNGYESSQDFLEKKSGKFMKVKAHNILSVLYDYGVIGFVLLSILTYTLSKSAIILFLRKKPDIIVQLGFMFAILLLSRFFLYYQTTIVWTYMMGIPFVAYAMYIHHFRKNALNVRK
jgi:hypothetical protein